MYTVWVIQPRDAAGVSLAYGLMGDYAVRTFTSIASFESLVKFGSRRSPDAVVIDVASGELQPEKAAAIIRSSLGSLPLIFVSTSEDLESDLYMNLSNCVCLKKPLDPFEFNRKICALMTSSRDFVARQLRYKDICFDCESSHLSINPSDCVAEVPPKEAQLLRLFIEKAGVCLSREHIREMIWKGTAITHRNIDSYVSRLRRRLVNSEVSITSIYGGGYIFK